MSSFLHKGLVYKKAEATHSPEELAATIRKVLTPDLLKPQFRDKAKNNPTFGHCYVASEALLHLLREQGETGWKPVRGKDASGIVHWWLLSPDGEKVDVTADQYHSVGEDPPYDVGRAAGFLTKLPSKRAQEVIRRVKQELGS